MQVQKQQLEPDMEQTGSKLGKEYIKAVYCHPAYFTYITYICYFPYILLICLYTCHAKCQAKIKISGRNISNLRCADDTALMVESEDKLKRLLIKVKEESEKVGSKLNIQKMKIMASVSSLHDK